MKANAPEKLYIDSREHWMKSWTAFTTKVKGDDIEYTHTDAFIEKACDFISLNVADYIDITHKGGIEHLALQERFIDAFRKYMKGE